jgi:fatty acid desaturase
MANNESNDNSSRIQNIVAAAKKQRNSGILALLGGLACIVVWCICYFSPAIWTNFIYLIIAGPIATLVGIFMIFSSSRKISKAKKETK